MTAGRFPQYLRYGRHPQDAIDESLRRRSARADRFRYWILGIDVVTVLFLIVTTFFESNPFIIVFDVLLGLYILADFDAFVN